MSSTPIVMNKVNEANCPLLFTSDDGSDEGWLIGNREGLIALRAAIDVSLASGEAAISEAGIEVVGIRCREEVTEPEREIEGSKSAKFGCLILIIACFLIFFYGIVDLLVKLF